MSTENKKLTVQERLFPDLKTKWKEVNLAFLHGFTGGNKPIVSDLEKQNKLLEYARMFPDTCSYGGFLEDRDSLWFDQKVPQYHLGIDFNNLPEKLSVHSLTNGVVFHIMCDTDKVNGWGGRVIIKNGNDYILYGHLCHDLPELGKEIKSGDKIGIIGESNKNGGWFRHLHLQWMEESYVEKFSKNLNLLDGYDFQISESIKNPMNL